MQLEQHFQLPVAPEDAWPAFKDIELLVRCLPGASLTGPAVDGELPLRFDVKLGPIAAAFAGSGRVTFDDAAQSGCFEGSAADKRTQSRVKGAADFELNPGGVGTIVQVRVNYALTGSLAQFSRGGIVRELANALTTQFASNLANSLAAVAAPADGSPDPAAAPHPAPAAPQALSVFDLIRMALKSRWQQLLRRFQRSPE
jgi:carbon monoxide dehydrogenase subunit G